MGGWMNSGNAIYKDVILEYGRTIENYDVYFVRASIDPIVFYPIFGKDYAQHISITSVDSISDINPLNHKHELLVLNYNSAENSFYDITDKFNAISRINTSQEQK